MGPVLNGLVKLQSVENRLRIIKTKLTRCRRNVVIQENQIGALRNALEAKKEDIQLTRMHADRLELELKSRDEVVAKLRANLNSAKTNKEYAALLTQLNTSKADNSKLEGQVLELMNEIETQTSESKEIEQQTEEQKNKLDGVRKDSESMAVKYETEIEQIQKEWDSVAKDMPKDMLAIFSRVAETYDGEALSLVEGDEDHKGSYSCGGCYMSITAETVNLLMSKDDIIRCPNCTRILVLESNG